MKAFGVRPKRDLGQNFLIDSNILDVIARAADLQPDDVVLEVGGGLGVLSEHLAARVRHVHVVELDRSLEPALRDALDPHPNTTLHLADAVKLDLAALEPAPDEGGRQPPLRRRRDGHPPHGRRAPAASRAGSPWSRRRSGSASPRSAGTAAVRRPVRARPAGLRRPGAAAGVPYRLPPRAERRLRPRRARPAAARRPRRRCARSCSTASRTAARRSRARSRSRPAPTPGIRDRARAALEAIGRPADARAEQLAPAEWRALHAGARADEGAALPRARRRSTCASSWAARATRRLPPARLARPAALARRRARARAGRRRRRRGRLPRRRRGEPRRARAGTPSAPRPAGTARRCGSTITKRVPVAGGMGGGSADAAATLRLAAAAVGPTTTRPAARARRSRSAPTSRAARPGALPDDRDRRARPPARRPGAVRRRRRALARTALDAGGLRGVRPPRPRPRRRRARPPERPGARAPRTSARCSPSGCCTTTWRRAARSLCPAIGDALASVRAAGAVRAMVSGSGPTVFGFFTGEDGPAHARAAAAALARAPSRRGRGEPVGRAYAAPQPV